MAKPKGQTQTQFNKMEKYAVPRVPATPGISTPDTIDTPEPSLSTIMAAISDLKQTLEPKLDAVTIDVSLLRADFQNMTEKDNRAETYIQALQSMSKRLEEHVQLLTKQQTSAELTADQCHCLRLKQQELRDRAENAARKYTLAVQRRLYDVVDKAGKLIVWLERRDMGRNWVGELRGTEGKSLTTGPGIAEAFASYYEQIHAS
ncbi:hypothetical protein NDU88_001514 [Pleurodeles waltl]|uniref:Uncharacterized protein n=1 Tax=Pleurodeles waltl TaxID=8319 RepID=A0AAV7NEF9_PLEWA|nr:hypothetical protein NDU88_001514 [Pleurodeles waltl]